MTEKEIEMAKYIKDNILPKLQEIQRDLALDEHIRMDVNMETYKLCVNAHFHVKTGPLPDSEFLCNKEFSFMTFLSDEKKMRECYEKNLRSIHHFVKNWQERLG